MQEKGELAQFKMVAKEDSIKIQSIDAVYSQKDPEIDTGKLLKIPLRETAAYIFCLILATVYVFLIAFRASAKDGFVIAILSYIFIASRLLGKIINFSFISDPLSKMVDLLSAKTANFSEKILLSILAAALVSTMLIVSLTTAETATGNRLQRMQSFLGIFVFLVVLVLFSKDRKNIPWRTVVVGMTLQYLIALFVLKTSVGVDIFSYISKLITKFLQLSEFGLIFLFGPDVLKIQNFIVAVFPAIVFFCSFVS